MSKHMQERFRQSEYSHGFRCSCGVTKDNLRTRQMVEDEIRSHREDVERARIALNGKGQTLQGAHTYYKYMAQFGHPDHRPLWQQLADETGHRLGKDSAGEDQTELFPLTDDMKSKVPRRKK